METSLNLPLSGTEVRAAICDKIAEALERDGRLSGHYAFRGFSFTATIEINLPGAVESRVEREIAQTVGELGVDPTKVSIPSEMPEMPVDEVRVETGQPVTVASIRPDGQMDTREVKYERPSKKAKRSTPAPASA